MRKKSAIKLAVIFVVLIAVGYVAIFGFEAGLYRVNPVYSLIKQGLDLRGGVYTVYQAKDPNVDADAIRGAMSVLRGRLDMSGYTEATVTLQGSDRIRIEIPDVKDTGEILKIIGSPALLQFLDPNGGVVIEGKDIKSARAARSEGNQPVVAFELFADGATRFAEATAQFLNQTIEIVLDGEVISAPTVNSVISSGSGEITNMESIDTAKNLAMLIMSGALPIELEQLEVRTVSATLGEKALENSLWAGLIGIILVFLFMAFVYRVPGIVADFALLIYMLIVLILLAFVPWVQLTLPGIAGIVLSIGMAVDANVIIFERIKEELRTGKTLRASINSGFSKAFSAIIDSNITTIIAAVVLLMFGTGSIKSFGITLLIGIVVSMFSAIFITRYLMRLFVDLNITNKKLYGFKEVKTQ